MGLGAFAISLAVKDLGVSIDFYEKLDFEVTGGAHRVHGSRRQPPADRPVLPQAR